MDFKKLKVNEIKAELAKLGLSQAGKKEILLERLEEAHKQTPHPEPQPQPEEDQNPPKITIQKIVIEKEQSLAEKLKLREEKFGLELLKPLNEKVNKPQTASVSKNNSTPISPTIDSSLPIAEKIKLREERFKGYLQDEVKKPVVAVSGDKDGKEVVKKLIPVAAFSKGVSEEERLKQLKRMEKFGTDVKPDAIKSVGNGNKQEADKSGVVAAVGTTGKTVSLEAERRQKRAARFSESTNNEATKKAKV